MKKILVPCDFSEPAIHAYAQAQALAEKSYATIHFLHVIEPPVMNDTLLMPTLSFEAELMKELETNAIQKFKEFTKKSKEHGTAVTYEIKYGAVPVVISQCIQDQSIDLVVMGSHGASGMKEYLIGSNAERIVRQSPVPVMIVKQAGSKPVKNIVFPNELNLEHQEDLTAKVKELQKFFDATLHIVWVNTPANFVADTVTRKRLDDFAKRYMFRNFTLNIFNHTSKQEGILEFAKLVSGDLIAIGTHGRTGIAHLLNTSIAEDVVNHSDGLVWTYTLKNEPTYA
ncbi:MAG: universal stress protein [Cytophagales bacterium]|jgi:nucleotide-binding universal stress UspA family protein|nr:universal stress protein [Bacteroidota bacterium]MBS1980420.1 universal stress protein [Bacteroidota bacterium]WHZ07735.1 MAG: universal stress protein [Cytophagales bacterium]